jgi:ABC-type phosphate transport system substrate-binding protein
MKFLVIFFGLSIILFGADYSVIVSKKLSFAKVGSQEIRDVFLQKRHTIGDQKIIPINLVGQDDGRSAFESVVLGMDKNRLNAYWVKQHFAGVNPPVTQPSFESIKAFVQNVEGAMGYIPSKMVDNNVKVIYEF